MEKLHRVDLLWQAAPTETWSVHMLQSRCTHETYWSTVSSLGVSLLVVIGAGRKLGTVAGQFDQAVVKRHMLLIASA
jgi:hypothetical protein